MPRIDFLTLTYGEILPVVSVQATLLRMLAKTWTSYVCMYVTGRTMVV